MKGEAVGMWLGRLGMYVCEGFGMILTRRIEASNNVAEGHAKSPSF